MDRDPFFHALKLGSAFLLAVSLVTETVASPAIRLLDTNAAPTLAVLAANNDDSTQAAADLLQQVLLGDPTLKLVERSDIEKVLQEQSLTAAFGAGTARDRIMLGGFLKANILVLLQRRVSEDGQHESMDVSVMETRMGLRVLREVVPWNKEARDREIQRLAAEVGKAVTRLHGAFHMIVAVPAFECGDISVDFLHLRQPYKTLAEYALLSRAGVLVVGIEDAEALVREQFLSSSTGNLERPLPYYLHGKYRNTGLGPDRAIALELALEHGQTTMGTERAEGVKENGVATALENAIGHLLGNLAPTPADTRPTGSSEARLLTEQGKTIRNTGSIEEAIPYFETAVLLDELFTEPRLQLFMACATLSTVRSETFEGVAYHISLMNRALDYLEPALPLLQGDLNERVIHGFDLMASRVGMMYMGSNPESEAEFERLMQRTMEIAAKIVESPAKLGWALHSNIAGALSYPAKRLSEYNPEAGVAARERLCHAYARRPEAFFYAYGLFEKWLDQDVDHILRSRLEKSDDMTTKITLRIYDLRKSLKDMDALNREWPGILALAEHNSAFEKALGFVRTKMIEPGLQQRPTPLPVELYVDEALPRARMEQLSFGETGPIRDWIIAGEHGDYFAAEQGVFRVDSGGQARKALGGNTTRLAWDETYLWAIQEGKISILDASGASVATVTSDDLNYTIHGSELKPVPLEPGWLCLIGNAETNGAMRRWVSTVDIRGSHVLKPVSDTLIQTTASKKDFMGNDWAVKWPGGPPYVVLTRGAQINISERTVSDYRSDLAGSAPFEHQIYRPNDTAFVWGTNTFLVAGSRDNEGHPRAQVQSAILTLPTPNSKPQAWLRHPLGLNPEGGSAALTHQAVFMADGWIHFVLEPVMRPAWFATNPKTRATRVVSYELPEQIAARRTTFSVFPSKVFDAVVVYHGDAYRVRLPPPEQWAFFGSPLEYHEHLVADPSTVAHRLSAMTISNVSEVAARGGLNERDEMGWTPLFHAVHRDNYDLLSALLAAGADPKVTTPKGTSPVLFAAGRGHPQGLRLLLQHGADPDYVPGKNLSALLEAVRMQRADCVQILLEGGADPNIAENVDGANPLHSAAFRGYADSVELLLKAKADPNAKIYRGHTPLHLAAIRGHADIARMLLKYGANPSLTAPHLGNGDGAYTPREFAVNGKHAEVVRILDEVSAGGTP